LPAPHSSKREKKKVRRVAKDGEKLEF
jgi:hypothetical protein